MSDKIKLGIAGTGLISNIFARFALQDGQYDIKSVLATQPVKATAFIDGIKAQPLPIDPRTEESLEQADQPAADLDDFWPSLHTKLEAFLASDIDTVYLGTPNSLHFKQAKAALLSQKNVIVEKPAVTEPDQFEELLEIAQSNQVHIIEAFRHIWDPNFRLIQNELEEFDALSGVSLAFRQYSSRYDDLKKGIIANVFKRELAGGALGDIGVYLISSLVALFGEPKTVKLYPRYLITGVDGNGIAILSYPGFDAVCQFSKNQASHQVCEFYDNSGNILSTDNIATLAWVKLNDKIISQGNPMRVDLSQEIHAFPQLFAGADNLAWTIDEINQISRLTHKTIGRLWESTKTNEPA
ncbi:MAG: Gfo/Idh/MocA family oxidoreductase [Bifidobacteriaceae bacterium]|jgi:predicted dehydrogenase|nr:Gfo/Idh/MocA family oxidoreductase [Bifidobacteriaceae bacterium]